MTTNRYGSYAHLISSHVNTIEQEDEDLIVRSLDLKEGGNCDVSSITVDNNAFLDSSRNITAGIITSNGVISIGSPYSNQIKCLVDNLSITADGEIDMMKKTNFTGDISVSGLTHERVMYYNSGKISDDASFFYNQSQTVLNVPIVKLDANTLQSNGANVKINNDIIIVADGTLLTNTVPFINAGKLKSNTLTFEQRGETEYSDLLNSQGGFGNNNIEIATSLTDSLTTIKAFITPLKLQSASGTIIVDSSILPANDNTTDIGNASNKIKKTFAYTSDIGNLSLTGNTLSSIDTNGNILIQPHGTGNVVVGPIPSLGVKAKLHIVQDNTDDTISAFQIDDSQTDSTVFSVSSNGSLRINRPAYYSTTSGTIDLRTITADTLSETAIIFRNAGNNTWCSFVKTGSADVNNNAFSGGTLNLYGLGASSSIGVSLSGLSTASSYINCQNVCIGGTTPNNCAKLDIQSSTRGFLPPRMGTAPASPIEGLMYFDTGLKKLRVHNGTGWETITSS